MHEDLFVLELQGQTWLQLESFSPKHGAVMGSVHRDGISL